MLRRTINSVDWVGINRLSLSRVDVLNPEELLPDGNPIRAIASDLVVTRYLGGDIYAVTPQIAESWLRTLGIEPSDDLVNRITLDANELYNDESFRERVLRTLYEQDLERRRRHPER